MPNPKKYLDYVGLTEYTSLLKDYISDQQHTINGYYDVTTTHKFYKNYDAGTFSNEITGALGNIYVDLLTNKLYKYDNNAYVEITTSVSTNFENSGVSAGTVTINGTSSTIKVPTGDTSSTVAVGNHTHNTTIATDSGTSTVDMSANTTYKLTAGGTNVIFKTPVDTTYVFDGTYNANTNKAATVSTVTNAISELPEPMVFKGSLGTGGTITTLPTASSSNKGYVYKVITAGTYASQSAKVGDTFISDGSAWVLIPSGDEPSGTVTNVAVANGGGLTVSGSPITTSGTITVGHSNSVTAKTSSSLKKFTYDANGHVTGSSELSTAESDALASGIDSEKVEQIETNKNNISKDEAALVELVDGGAKNLWDFKNALYNGKSADASYTKTDTDITVTSNGAWSCVIYRVNGLKTGQRYIWSARISDYSVQSDTCRLRISSDGASQRPIATQTIEGNGNVYLEFVGQPELYFAYYINFNATSYQNTYKASENMICTKAEWDISHEYQPYKPNVLDSKMTRKQAITNGMYLVERQPKATTNPDTGNPYIYASFADFNHDFDSVEGITLTQFGIIYCNDGTAKVDELRLENVDDIHIIKKDSRSGSNLPVSGTNPVTAVGFAQYQDSDGVTSDVLYTNDIGGDYRLLNAPSDIVALQQTIGDINSVLEEVL